MKVLTTLDSVHCYSEYKEKWSPKDPTRGYYYRLAEVTSFQLKKLGIEHDMVQIENKRVNHWFVVVNDSVIDLTTYKNMKCHTGKRRSFFPCNDSLHNYSHSSKYFCPTRRPNSFAFMKSARAFSL
jgi:hypothetical protein